MASDPGPPPDEARALLLRVWATESGRGYLDALRAGADAVWAAGLAEGRRQAAADIEDHEAALRAKVDQPPGRPVGRGDAAVLASFRHAARIARGEQP